jgi:hypothetical protein
MSTGLDGRARDEDGRIREKSGATKMGTLADKYPELAVFDPNATLSGIRARYGIHSIEEVRELAKKRRSEKS